jgi:Tfp pilus assembly protein PilV
MKIQIAKTRPLCRAFTLLEVMFAVIIFFTGSFAILALVSQSIDNARRLQRPTVDAGLLASELSLTNQLVEGTESGNLGELLGDAYNGYTWTRQITEVQSNKLFQADFILQGGGPGKPVVSEMKVLFFRPQSPAGSLEGATVAQ